MKSANVRFGESASGIAGIAWGLILFTFAVTSPARSAAAALPPEAERVARDFLYAFSRNDRESIQRMLPKSAAEIYGPCPFARMPHILKPRADKRVAAVDFEGLMADPNLPSRGIMVLRRVEEGSSVSWRARQLYWFNDLPSEAEIPDRSPTEADRRQEPEVRQAAIEFIRAWLHGRWDKMDSLTFHWWKVPRRPPNWVKLVGVQVEGRPTTLNGIRIDFDAKLRFAGLLPKRVRGNLWLVREGDYWRVRPLTFSFLF